jgi:hypothetical protein
VDWEPMMGDLYTRFMTSFKLPVTYGNSGKLTVLPELRFFKTSL